jgi:hypothetical protein
MKTDTFIVGVDWQPNISTKIYITANACLLNAVLNNLPCRPVDGDIIYRAFTKSWRAQRRYNRRRGMKAYKPFAPRRHRFSYFVALSLCATFFAAKAAIFIACRNRGRAM